MKETTPGHSWKQKDGKCKQNSWKEAAGELIVLTCKEHSCVLSKTSEQLLQVYLYNTTSSFRWLFYNIYSLGIHLLYATVVTIEKSVKICSTVLYYISWILN